MTSFGSWRHICVDMQRIFAEDTPWQMPWFDRVLPQIEELSGKFASRTIFTQFIPPQQPEVLQGKWRDYYRKWWMMTGEHMPADMAEVVTPLAKHIPPARTYKKFTYSPWLNGEFHRFLEADGVDTLVITGGETDVCVLATVLGSIDHGYRTIVLSDAVCSSADSTHDASLKLLGDRFSVQLELMSADDFLRSF